MEVESSMSHITRGDNCVYDWSSMLTYEQENAYLALGDERVVFHFYSGSARPTSVIRKMTKTTKKKKA